MSECQKLQLAQGKELSGSCKVCDKGPCNIIGNNDDINTFTITRIDYIKENKE